jgi:hypothetical protein
MSPLYVLMGVGKFSLKKGVTRHSLLPGPLLRAERVTPIKECRVFVSLSSIIWGALYFIRTIR